MSMALAVAGVGGWEGKKDTATGTMGSDGGEGKGRKKNSSSGPCAGGPRREGWAERCCRRVDTV